MTRLELDDQVVDLSVNDTKISLTKSISDYNNPNKLTGSYTLPFQLPFTNRNRQIFGYADDSQPLRKFKVFHARLYVDEVLILEGDYQFKGVLRDKQVFDGQIIATNLERIADILDDKYLNQVSSFDLIDFEGDLSVFNACNDVNLKYEQGNTYHAFTYLIDTFHNLNTPHPNLAYDYFGLSLFTGGIFEKVFQDAGYSVAGTILTKEEWQRLIMLYTDNGVDGYNYGALVPMEIYLPSPGFFQVYNALQQYERTDDVVYVQQYEGVANGDLAHCYYNGVYTPKYSGDYTIQIGGQSEVNTSGGQLVPNQQFVVLREIGDNDFIPTTALPPNSSFNAASTLDSSIMISTVGAPQLVRLTKGKQYRVQTYISILKSNIGSNNINAYYKQGHKFTITACNGKMQINPADFLSTKVKKREFISLMFKLFNLYYELNDDIKTITFYTRDEFFIRRASEIIDLSNYTNIHTWNDYPFTQDEVDSIFYTYLKDESDYVLGKTDYYDKITIPAYSTANSLIVAPVSMMRVKVKGLPDGAGNYTDGYDLVPTAIATTDSVDDSTLLDDTGSGFSYEPKIAFYYSGSMFYADQLKTAITQAPFQLAAQPHPLLFTFTKNVYTGFPPFGSYSIPAPEDYAYFPKLFFDVAAEQPAYEVVVDTVRRSFSVVATDPANTIWATGDTNFLEPGVVLPELSLNPNNGKSLFQQLYTQNIKTATNSYYTEGYVHINSTLYNRLTQGLIVKIDTLYYIVDSISDYNAGGTNAKVRLYRYI